MTFGGKRKKKKKFNFKTSLFSIPLVAWRLYNKILMCHNYLQCQFTRRETLYSSLGCFWDEMKSWLIFVGLSVWYFMLFLNKFIRFISKVVGINFRTTSSDYKLHLEDVRSITIKSNKFNISKVDTTPKLQSSIIAID